MAGPSLTRALSPRTFLVHGLLAGLVAGFAAFLVAHQLGEPPLDAAIAVEAAHHHEGAALVSRADQSTWGLATATLGIGTTLGGLVALAAAAAVGRIGRLRPSQSTALVVLVGFTAAGLVPFWKYPASPPAVSRADTIGDRTAEYFAFAAISVVAAVAATVLAARLLPRVGTYRSVLAGVGGYLAVAVLAGSLMPAVVATGDVPAQTLWLFRRASLATQATLWAVLGVALVGLVGRTHRTHAERSARRELAASL